MKIAPFELERFFERYEFTTPFLLCTSDCETLSIRELLDDQGNSISDFLNLRLGYTETRGSESLREAISKLYETQPEASILVCSGAEEAIFLFMNACFSPGDHLIVQFPVYQSLYEIPRSIGCDITFWHSNPENRWRLDLNFLADAITPRTRAIIFNSPHNPTGMHLSREEFQRIIEIAQKHNLYVFSDEVYRFLEYRDEERLPAAADLYDKAVSLGVLSKSFGLAGLRIGWTATQDMDLLNRMASLKDYTTICASAPSEFLATIALQKKEHILARNRALVSQNLSLLNRFMHSQKSKFEWIQPGGGCLAFPKLAEPLDPGFFYENLQQKKGVLLLPGNHFGMDPRFFRIGFGRKNFPSGLLRLQEFIEE